ncbi:MAG: hypothetical protein OHK0031_17560 [Anaerolineales bacterium]
MRLKPLFLSALLLAWLTMALSLYAWISRVSYLQGFLFPGVAIFAAQLARITPSIYFLDLLRAFGGMTVFALAALALGLSFLPRHFLSKAPPLTRGVIAFIFGEILFSLFFLTVLRLWKLPPWLTAAALALSLLLGFPALRRFFRSLPPPVFPAGLRRADRILLVLALSLFALGLTLSSARLGYDAVAEYFSHAKIMALTSLPVFFYPKDSFVVSSFHPGILLTAQIQLFGDQSARMISWLNGAALLLLTWALGERLSLSPRARLCALLLLVTSTAFLDLTGDGKIELIVTAPILAAVYLSLTQERPFSDPGEGVLLGLLAGFAIISRPYNIFLVPLFATLLFLFAPEFSWRKTFQAIFPLSLSSLSPYLAVFFSIFALGLFHLWQNWLWLGSPLAPLTYARELNSGLWQWQFDPSLVTTLKWFYPLTLTFFNTPQSLGNISPLFVGFLPFLLLPALRRGVSLSPQLRALLLAALLTLLIWVIFFFTVVEIRYVLFLWIFLFLPAGQLIESALEHGGRLLRPLMALLLLFLGLRMLLVALGTYSPLDASGQARCYDVPLCTFFQPVNEIAAPGERVFVLNAYRYYLRPDLFACSSRADEYPALESLARQNAPDFWEQLYSQGFHYVIFEHNFAEFRSRFGVIPSPENIPAWLKVMPLAYSEDMAVYRLQADTAPAAPTSLCRQSADGAWQLFPENLVKK